MTNAKLNEIVDKLCILLPYSCEFNGITIKINFAKRAKHSKNWVIDTHYHPWFEFNYVSKGSVFTTINGSEFLITAGHSYIIPPGIPHSHRHNGTGDDGICIRFSLECRTQNDVKDVLYTPYASSFNSGLDKMNLSGGIQAMQAEFAAWIMRIYDLRHTDPPSITAVQNSFAAQVILYLKEYYSEKIKAEDIANALHTSYRTLARKFKAETGITISDKLSEIRINKAKQLLISTNLSMYDIALKTGYENEFYFSKMFKQHENISPKFYRTKYSPPGIKQL